MRSPADIERLALDILKRTEASSWQFEYAAGRSLSFRFGQNSLTQNRNTEIETARVTLWFENRHASSSTNLLDASSLHHLAVRVEGLARDAPEDSECVHPLSPQQYVNVPCRFDAGVASMEPHELTPVIADAVKAAMARGFTASGLFERRVSAESIITSAGLSAHDRSTMLDFSTTMHGPWGSGRGSSSAWTRADLNASDAVESAIRTAELSRNPVDIRPGDYTVILEPQAISDLMPFLLWSMDARDASEGTTAFAGSLGQKIFNSNITICTELNDRRIPGAPFGESGLPMRSKTWIENGVVRHLFHDRYWARTRNQQPDAGFYPVVMSGTTRSVDDLVADCDHGLLVKRLWYIRWVDRKALMLTGMTRDGLFLIRDGRIHSPVKNLRFNESLLTVLGNVRALSTPWYVGGRVRLPGIMTTGFTFSSTTDSV